MHKYARLTRLRAALTVLLACFVAMMLLACKRKQASSEAPGASAAVAPAEPVSETVVRISARQDGTLMLDGAQMTPEQALQNLQAMDPAHTVIWYYREAPREPPHPAVAGVVRAIAELGLPVSLSTQPDFSDFVGLDKKSRPRPPATP